MNERWNFICILTREGDIRIVLNHEVIIHVFCVNIKKKFIEKVITYRCDNDMASSFLYVTQRIVRIDSAPNLQTAYFHQSSQ